MKCCTPGKWHPRCLHIPPQGLDPIRLCSRVGRCRSGRLWRQLRQTGRVIVVEGYMDLLALYSNGIKNVVATLGTALTENHVRLLKRWTQNVVLVFDGDQAGQTASERSLVQFFKHDMMPQIFVLPEGKDPDDFVNEEGRDRFIEKAKESEDLFLNRLKMIKYQPVHV